MLEYFFLKTSILSFDKRISDAGNIINLSSIFDLDLFLCVSASKNENFSILSLFK